MAASPDRTVESIDSRWWYWIVAYPVLAVLAIPLVLGVLIFAAAILFTVEATTSATAPDVLIILTAFVVALLGVTVLGVALAIFVLLPVALYFDAKAVDESAFDWNPDPFVYALLAAMQFFVTPVIGFVVALYYLYHRHRVVGVP